MWSFTDSELLLIGTAGLVTAGLFLFGVVLGLLRPALYERARAGGWSRLRRWLPKLTRLGLVALGVGIVLMLTAFVGGTVVGRGPIAHRGDTTSTVPANAMAISAPTSASVPAGRDGRWMSGDLHTHTFLTGGLYTQADVTRRALDSYRLDWLANAEHGGWSSWDPAGNPSPNTPRWWSLINWSWPIMSELRTQYPGRVLFQGLEWNVPKHGHASVGIAYDDPTVVGEFDYRFDARSRSTTFPGIPPKDNKSERSAINAVNWLQTNYRDHAYVVLNHPSRWLNYSAADIRDFIDAGPQVVAGFEGMPGHQKQRDRGGYVLSGPLGRTYQGADIWLAQVGGVWDSILANGHRFHVFADSDFHATNEEFWPGEYTKNWTFVERENDVQSVVNSLKSGRSFTAFGDLVDGLRFSAQTNGGMTDMSRDALAVRRGDDVIVTVKFHTPPRNHNGDAPKVDHLDLIAGNVTGPAVKNTPSWEASTNPSARVIGTFDAATFQDLGDGWQAVTYLVPNVQGPMYLRLRATNIPRNTPAMTDAAGNPLMDTPRANSESQAWKSLWFYSNPVWIDVRK